MPHGICRPAEQARQSLSSLSKLSLEDFRNVEQSANAARNAQKAKYQGMLSLYLNVIYQIIKNMPSELIIQIPTGLLAGPYTLRITTQYSSSNAKLKVPKTFDYPLTLVNE